MTQRRNAPAYDALASRDLHDLRWLLRLRWAALLGQLVTVAVVAFPMRIELPLIWIGLLLGIELAGNLWLEVALRRGHIRRSARRLNVVVMATDILMLSGLLYLTGGLGNPFSTFYSVHVVLAAVLLRRRWAYAGALLSIVSLLFLSTWYRPLPALEQDPSLVLRGLLISLSLTVGFTVLFVTRVSRALEARNAELSSERERQARAERLEALGTLAAGAAHELASPLSTIAVVAKELELRLERESAAEADLVDARLLREEVGRCRRILDRMTLESGDSAGEELVSTTVEELLEEVVVEVGAVGRVTTSVHSAAGALTLFIPRMALAQALRSVVANALDASEEGQGVRLEARREAQDLLFTVEDDGHGMDSALVQRATDPFFTTKEPGRGMGLGLFLTRSVFERLGGDVSLESSPGLGTRVSLRLPLTSLSEGAGQNRPRNMAGSAGAK